MSPLGRALAVAEATDRVWSFLEHRAPMVALLQEAARRDIEARYARRILDAFEAMGRAGAHRLPPASAETPPAQAGLVEPLSEREMEVLRLLATTLSGPEIADQLCVSLSTFRSHTKSIYGKLDVHSRLDAVAQASALGLLPS
jgi:LuxR family maltose regulon positive regulatory protein